MNHSSKTRCPLNNRKFWSMIIYYCKRATLSEDPDKQRSYIDLLQYILVFLAASVIRVLSMQSRYNYAVIQKCNIKRRY